MSTISLRLPDTLLAEVTRHSKELHIPRTEYIRQSLINMNQQTALEMNRQRIMQASMRVREQSMQVNAEFDTIEQPET